MRDAFVRVLLEEMAVNDRIVLITGDLGFGVLQPVWDCFPDRIINAGIAEQGMIGMAAGLASTGRIVFVYSIGNFPTLRPLEQIRNDCAYPGLNVKVVCVGGGFVYGSLGMSHHATEDMAIMRALPGMTCFAPGDPAEAEAVTRTAIRTAGTCYIRLGRGNEPKVHKRPIREWYLPAPLTIRRGKDIALLSSGGILTQTAEAARILEQRGISAEVISFPCFKPMDRDAVRRIAERFPILLTAEEHNVTGGFGSAVCEITAELGNGCRIFRIGLKDCYTAVVGNQQYLREVYGMDAESIADRAEALINEKRTDA